MTARQESRLSTSNTGQQPPRDSTAEVDGLRAFELFCTPALSNRRSANHRSLVERARHHLRQTSVRRLTTTVGTIQTYTYVPETEPASSVLLVHGWTGEAAFMGAFGDFLRRRGFRAILMDSQHTVTAKATKQAYSTARKRCSKWQRPLHRFTLHLDIQWAPLLFWLPAKATIR